MLPIQEPHFENHYCKTWCETEGERNYQCFGAVKESLHRHTGALGASMEGCEGRLQLTCGHRGKDRTWEFRCGESLCRACTGGGRRAGELGTDGRPRWSHAKEFRHYPLDIDWAFNQKGNVELCSNCSLIKNKKVLIIDYAKKCYRYKKLTVYESNNKR